MEERLEQIAAELFVEFASEASQYDDSFYYTILLAMAADKVDELGLAEVGIDEYTLANIIRRFH